MRYFCTILCLLICHQFNAKAQRNFKPGYVVTLNGDTTRGFVDYKEWHSNPREFKFKSNASSDKTETYKLSNALAFGINGFEYYKRYILSIRQGKTGLSALSIGIDTTHIIDTVFLQIISTGKHVTLYSYNEIIKQHFFISEGNAAPTELIYQRYLNPAQTSEMLILNSYIRQLQHLSTLYQPGNEKLARQVLSTEYTAKDLEKIISAINEQGPAGEGVPGSRFFAGIGLTIPKAEFNGQHVLTSAGSSSIFPKIGAGIDVYFNRNVRALIFRAELSLSGNKSDIMYNGEANTPYTQHIKFNQYWVNLSPQLLYNVYNADKAKVYLAAGIGINYSTYANKSSVVDYYLTNSNTIIRSSEEKFPDPQALFCNVTTKLGLVINNKLDVYAGYNLPTSITNYVDYSINLSSYQIGINLLFRGK